MIFSILSLFNESTYKIFYQEEQLVFHSGQKVTRFMLVPGENGVLGSEGEDGGNDLPVIIRQHFSGLFTVLGNNSPLAMKFQHFTGRSLSSAPSKPPLNQFLSNSLTAHLSFPSKSQYQLNKIIIINRKLPFLNRRLRPLPPHSCFVVFLLPTEESDLQPNSNSMQYSLGHKGYDNRTNRNFDAQSQVSNVSGLAGSSLKPIDLSCQFHIEEPCNNYCIETKCFQPLCSECIEDHLLHHKKHGYSDLAIKSIRGVRKECVGKLGAIIDELLKRLGQLEPPPSPERILENLEARLEESRRVAHEIVEQEFNRLRDSLRVKISESTTILKGMNEIHSRLQNLIEQLKQTYITLAEGKRGNVGVPECLRKTLTLDGQSLLETFDNEGLAYEARRKKVEFDVLFNPEILKTVLAQSIKITSPSISLSASNVSVTPLRPKPRNNYVEQKDQFDSRNPLPSIADPTGNKILHFFETGSNHLHLIEIDNRRKGISRTLAINQFVVPSFHASLISSSGENIYLSGGIIELNGGSKSPLFMRYSLRSQTCKKDFARVRPRSSHSLCQDESGDIFILGGYGQADHSGDDPVYETTVQKVNERTGRVQIEAASHWGGSNIAFSCKGYVLKACEEGIELYNVKIRQWTIAEVRCKPKSDYFYFRNAGHATIQDGEIIVFGGYFQDCRPTNECYYWRVGVEGGRMRVNISKLACRLTDAEGFDNGGSVVDEQGCFALQNIQDDEQSCLDNERRLVRFDLKDGGEWKALQILEEEQ